VPAVSGVGSGARVRRLPVRGCAASARLGAMNRRTCLRTGGLGRWGGLGWWDSMIGSRRGAAS
jgi:hypothetical protein